MSLGSETAHTAAKLGSSALHTRGTIMVAAAAVCWSTGGLIVRHVETDQWNIVFWRGFFAALTLLIYLSVRDGRRMLDGFRNLGLPGLAVAACFATASLSFVVALHHTKVATILILQSTSPLIAGTLAWFWLKERMSGIRWVSMGLALSGVAVMVWDGEAGGDLLGLFLSALIAAVFALATVIVRRYREIPMTPATCLAAIALMLAGAIMGTPVEVNAPDLGLLFLFGTFQLALGLILFTGGARHIPAGEAILLCLLECILAPIWVWIWPGIREYPGDMALIGGAIVLSAVILSTASEMRTAKHIAPPVE